MKQSKWIIGLVGVALTGLIGCQLFDHDRESLTVPEMSAARPENFIIGQAETSDWKGDYTAGKPYFAINVPVIGALNITYTLTTGAQFALFVETSAATKMYIGLNTINGVTDVLQNACVTYAAGVTAFASVPADAVKATHSKVTHYQRRNVTGGDENWWLADAAFGFGVPETQLKTVCMFEPTPETPPVTTTCGGVQFGGFCWYAGNRQSCNTVCAAHGGVASGAETFWASHTTTDCQNLLNQLRPGTATIDLGVYSGKDACVADAAFGGRFGTLSGSPHDPTVENTQSYAACHCVN